MHPRIDAGISGKSLSLKKSKRDETRDGKS